MPSTDIVIKVCDVSKQYRLGKIGTGTLAHDINRWWHTIRGKDNPYLKIGDANDRTLKTDSQYVWALRNISFDVKHGEVVGIVGRNGAGKSTLLKILSRTTTPTLGNIKIKGRVASLLEVGTGFNPELNGRENIFLNGAILGMTNREIKTKFDEIVAFAGVEKYIETPVKRYSSGMYVRLAFAVAAHLEPEILIVDEVLAVGDAEFQRKAIGKMKDVSTSEGRTVLFVSHNMAAVKSLCTSGILLENGRVAFCGGTDETLAKYTEANEQIGNIDEYTPDPESQLDLLKLQILSKNGNPKTNILSGDYVAFELTCRNLSGLPVVPAIGFYDMYDNPLFLCGGKFKNIAYDQPGIFKMRLEIDRFPLMMGDYYINVELKCNEHYTRYLPRLSRISVENGDYYGTGITPGWRKGVLIDFEWK